MRRRGPVKPIIPAVVLYLAIVVPGIVLTLRDEPGAGETLILVGGLGAALFVRWYTRRYFR
jgi:hypothetical protein